MCLGFGLRVAAPLLITEVCVKKAMYTILLGEVDQMRLNALAEHYGVKRSEVFRALLRIAYERLSQVKAAQVPAHQLSARVSHER